MKKLVLVLVMALVSLTSFSQVTLSQEDYNKLSPEAKDSIEQCNNSESSFWKALRRHLNMFIFGREIWSCS